MMNLFLFSFSYPNRVSDKKVGFFFRLHEVFFSYVDPVSSKFRLFNLQVVCISTYNSGGMAISAWAF